LRSIMATSLVAGMTGNTCPHTWFAIYLPFDEMLI
jgi:hypothetical protein